MQKNKSQKLAERHRVHSKINRNQQNELPQQAALEEALFCM